MDLVEQFKELLNPSATLGAFLISFIAGCLVSFFFGVKYGVSKKNSINVRENNGEIYQDVKE